jgi:Sec-independent protein translocase protein TatA
MSVKGQGDCVGLGDGKKWIMCHYNMTDFLGSFSFDDLVDLTTVIILIITLVFTKNALRTSNNQLRNSIEQLQSSIAQFNVEMNENQRNTVVERYWRMLTEVNQLVLKIQYADFDEVKGTLNLLIYMDAEDGIHNRILFLRHHLGKYNDATEMTKDRYAQELKPKNVDNSIRNFLDYYYFCLKSINDNEVLTSRDKDYLAGPITTIYVTYFEALISKYVGVIDKLPPPIDEIYDHIRALYHSIIRQKKIIDQRIIIYSKP